MRLMWRCGQYPEEEVSVIWLQAKEGEGEGEAAESIL